MFKFLIITFVIIYILSRFAGYFLRLSLWLLGKQVKKNFEKQQQQNKQTVRKEGEIEIITSNNQTAKYDFNDGEYVDFEEIKAND